MKRYGFFAWLIRVPAWLAVRSVAMSCVPVAVKWFSTDDKRGLRQPFGWLGTLDWDLCGDPKWRAYRMPRTDLPCTDDINRRAWLWRNGANAFNITVLGAPADAEVWQFNRPIPIGKRYYLDPFLGWTSKALGPARRRNYKLQCRIKKQGEHE